MGIGFAVKSFGFALKFGIDQIYLRCCFCHSSLSTSSQASTDDDELMMMITQHAPLAHDSTSGAGKILKAFDSVLDLIL